MDRRVELQHILEHALGSKNVYFKPPIGLKMQYPCIRYRLVDLDIKRANNKVYSAVPQYELIYISQDQATEILDRLLDIPTINPTRMYEASGLYHNMFTLYF